MKLLKYIVFLGGFLVLLGVIYVQELDTVRLRSALNVNFPDFHLLMVSGFDAVFDVLVYPFCVVLLLFPILNWNPSSVQNAFAKVGLNKYVTIEMLRRIASIASVLGIVFWLIADQQITAQSDLLLHPRNPPSTKIFFEGARILFAAAISLLAWLYVRDTSFTKRLIPLYVAFFFVASSITVAKYHALLSAFHCAEVRIIAAKQPELQNKRTFLLGQDAERYAFLTLGDKGQRSVIFVAKTEVFAIIYLGVVNLAEGVPIT